MESLLWEQKTVFYMFAKWQPEETEFSATVITGWRSLLGESASRQHGAQGKSTVSARARLSLWGLGKRHPHTLMTASFFILSPSSLFVFFLVFYLLYAFFFLQLIYPNKDFQAT